MENQQETLRRDLLSHFGNSLDEDLVNDCITLCQNYNLDASSLFYKWEAMKYGTQGLVIFTKESVAALRQNIQRDLEKAALAAKKASLKNARFGLPTRNSLVDLRRSTNTSIATPSKTPNQSTTVIPAVQPGSSKLKFSWVGSESSSQKERGYRYMYEKLSERSELLDDQIEDIADIIKDHYGVMDFGDPGLATEEEVVVVGRITLDGDSSSSGSVKINEASIALESSRSMGSGVRVQVKFNHDFKITQCRRGPPTVGIFPGAIVALKGKNGGGGWFAVSEVLTIPPLHHDKVSSTTGDESAFTMFVAAGPFTSDADLQYKPWQAMLAKVKSEQPDVVLLIGPFIDHGHSLVRQGEMDITPWELFKSTFVDNLKDFLDLKPSATVLIVPSVKDILSDHVAYPQSAFSYETCGDPRIRLLSNPCQFSLNGLSFAVTSVDVLFHLRKEEFVKRAQDTSTSADGDVKMSSNNSEADPMANLCRHLVEQRSFYPIFPVPNDLMHEVNLDVTHSDFLKFGGEKGECPDVLVTPSRLKYFVKSVDDITAVNPSFLTKGTFASLKYSGGHTKKESIKVEISKLE
ncbi:DNA polymerase alpha/epsilon subunit B-domain-containing protein [Abortiporus biennis]|nr:DNA polymerase alpha/epsilon subunit B-domain-containing protein [Abortiporus biennis]